MIGYRFVTDDLRSEHGDVQWRIGEWQKQGGKLELCQNGFHASKDPVDSLQYAFGSKWFKAETKGKIIEDLDKFVAEEMRLVKEIPITVLMQFALDCAKHVLHLFEKGFPDDKRPRFALEAVEAWLNDPTKEKRKKRDVACAAGAARAARAAGDAARAAGDAAWAAGAARAGRAAGNAAWAAERKWQNERLKQLIKEAP